MKDYAAVKAELTRISASLNVIRKVPELETLGEQYGTFFCSLSASITGAMDSIDDVLASLAQRYEYAEPTAAEAKIMYLDNKAKERRIEGES